MDFALLPPEVNSARMYTGPGAGSLLAAAGGWDSLAAELATTAEAYGSVLSGLAALHWRGPAAESMAVTAAPYIGWLYTTAEKTQQTAIQARAAALAFEQAYAMTLPPPVVAANRIQLLALIDELLRPEHCGDRGHRGTVRRDVGPGRRRDVRLRHRLSGCGPADTVLPAAADHQPGRPDLRPPRSARPPTHCRC